MKNKFYITTPIYYVNAKPHVGHAYTTVAADVLARASRLVGQETFFLTGTDEHGAKIEEIAGKVGKEPRAFVDEVAAQFQEAWRLLSIVPDKFIRTTEPEHTKAVQRALQAMYDAGDIYKGSYEGLYCKGCEQFKTENDLVDGLCLDHKTAPEAMREESYMFKLSKYSSELLNAIESGQLPIVPDERKNEIVSFYKKEGLKDVSFSRKNVAWGIPVPWDTEHTIYVWADAFLNYLTGLGWDGTPGVVPDFWPADVQLMSKDILRVHATIWPAMLLALKLPLPKKLLVHGFFLIDGQKMSKSLGNIIAPEELVQRYGADAARYLLMSATPFGNDGDIGIKKFDEKYTADLANGIGNLVQRVVTLIENNCGGAIAYDVASDTENDDAWFDSALKDSTIAHILERAFDVIKKSDVFMNEQKPWALAKTDTEKFKQVMQVLVSRIHHIAWWLQPFMPETSQKIFATLGSAGERRLADGFTFSVKKGPVLFPRLPEAL